MVAFRCSHLRIAVVLALVTAPAGLGAQRRVTLSPGLALGMAFNSAGTGAVASGSWTRGRHALLTLDVEAANIPARLRGEMMAVSLPQAHGPVSLGASVVLPLGRDRLRPYALAGLGVYGVGGVTHPLGWSVGGGAEYRTQAATLFVEGRRHKQTPSAVSVGLRF